MRGLIDCDNFFVSCERAVRPELNGVPVVVLSNNDGCVVARSNEAKMLGIRMGVPVFEIRDLVRSGKVIALSGHHRLYSDISRHTHEIVREYVPRSIDYSVDEAFMDVDGIPIDMLDTIGHELYSRIRKEVGIPVTIGFSRSKALSKLAVESIKKTPVHVRVMVDEGEIRNYISTLPVNELWGIGRRLVKRLYYLGVFTAGDFYERPRNWVREKMGITGERLWLELHGVDCISLDYKEHSLQESISETRTFRHDTSNYDWIESKVTGYVRCCAHRLRAMRGECSAVNVFLRTNRFRQNGNDYRPDIDVILPDPTSDSVALTRAAIKGLRKIFRDDVSYKRAGVTLFRITPAHARLMSLFEEIPDDGGQQFMYERRRHLMKIMDSFGADVNLRLASEFGM